MSVATELRAYEDLDALDQASLQTPSHPLLIHESLATYPYIYMESKSLHFLP